jgi:hypothetical protein
MVLCSKDIVLMSTEYQLADVVCRSTISLVSVIITVPTCLRFSNSYSTFGLQHQLAPE